MILSNLERKTGMGGSVAELMCDRANIALLSCIRM